MRHLVCLLLGSNIEPEVNLPRAAARLRQHLKVLKASSVWESPPLGGKGPNYLNAALLVETDCEAAVLKQGILLPLETAMGRVRTADKNSPRTIDLDIIYFDQQVMDPSLWKYAHRAVPVAEVMPETQDGKGFSIKAEAASMAARGEIWLRSDISL